MSIIVHFAKNGFIVEKQTGLGNPPQRMVAQSISEVLEIIEEWISEDLSEKAEED